jgi:hypothetical protein
MVTRPGMVINRSWSGWAKIRLLTRHPSGGLRVDVLGCTTTIRLRMCCERHPSGLLRIDVLQCHPCGSPRVDVLRCTTPLASPNVLPATTTWFFPSRCFPRGHPSGSLRVGVFPVHDIHSSLNGLPAQRWLIFDRATRQVVYESVLFQCTTSRRLRVASWRAGMATPAGVFDRMFPGPPPGIRESMLSQGTTPGCLRPGCWRARPPVVFDCAAGLPVVSKCAAGPPIQLSSSRCFPGARLPGNFQVDVDPVDNFGSSSTGVRARLPVVSECPAGARFRIGVPRRGRATSLRSASWLPTRPPALRLWMRFPGNWRRRLGSPVPVAQSRRKFA